MPINHHPHLFVCLGLFLLILVFLISHIQNSDLTRGDFISSYSAVSLSRLSTCPSVHIAGRRRIDHSKQTCYPVPSKISHFGLELCYVADSCNEFTARITRTRPHECHEAELTPDPSKDRAISNWMRKERGPDAFYLRTDGAERYASVYSKYIGKCKYEFDVALKNAGQSYLQIWWTFERYTAFSETNSSWPAMLLSPLSDPVALPACPSSCMMRVAAPLLPTQGIVTLPAFSPTPSPPVVLSSSTWDHESATLPNCSSSFPIPGSFIPAHPLDVIYPPEVLPQPVGKPVVGRYSFIPESCKWRHAGLRFGDPSRCTQRHTKMLISGDSHGRVLYDSIVHRLQGRTDLLSDSEKIGSKSAVINQFEVNFLWDPRGIDFLSHEDSCSVRVQNSDIVVVSTIVHWTDSPTSLFLSQLRSTLIAFSACPYTPPPHAPHQKRKQILLFSPAAIQRQDEFVIQYKDHRTNIRLLYWRSECLKMAKELGWDVVDQFELTLPHSLEPLATDAGHYLLNDALDPIVDEVLGKTGLCD